MPITNDNPNGSAPRGRGRPALGNIDRLLARFCDAYRAGDGLSLSTIATEFEWTEGTARAMVSQVRTTHNVTIYYRRRSSKFYLQSLPANAPSLQSPGRPASPAPVAAPAPAPSLGALIRERLDGQSTVAARTEPAPVPVPVPDTMDSIVALLRAANTHRDEFEWRLWLNERITGSMRFEPVSSFLVTPTWASVRARVQTFIVEERRRAASRAPVTPPVPDTLWRGIDPVVAAFYRERALDLRQ